MWWWLQANSWKVKWGEDLALHCFMILWWLNISNSKCCAYQCLANKCTTCTFLAQMAQIILSAWCLDHRNQNFVYIKDKYPIYIFSKSNLNGMGFSLGPHSMLIIGCKPRLYYWKYLPLVLVYPEYPMYCCKDINNEIIFSKIIVNWSHQLWCPGAVCQITTNDEFFSMIIFTKMNVTISASVSSECHISC